MNNITRRHFLKKSARGLGAVAAASLLSPPFAGPHARDEALGTVKLGKTSVAVSRLALGTGTNGWKHASNQTRMGLDKFLELSETAYDSGITFFDVADIYGSHTFLKQALKQIPREKVVILTKIWTLSTDWLKFTSANDALDRFRKEIGTDYLDIVLLHCQTDGNWPQKLEKARDELSTAKAKGVIRAHGVSCHHFDALKTAAAHDWVDVILARINHTGSHMDDTPDKVMPVLKHAHDSGKGVLGMKIFGCGDLTDEEQRETSLKYVWGSGNVDAMTIGFEDPGHITDTVKRTRRILSS